jgi:uncharacterized protein YndB with AHSA1/START domain
MIMVTKSATDGARSQEDWMSANDATAGAQHAAPGALVVRRSIQIKATPERIWREFESFERFSAWWSTDDPGRTETVRAYDPRAGGRVEMPCSWGPNGDEPSGACVFEGNITSFEPQRELTWELSIEGDGWPAPTYVTVRLTPNDYGTLVEILHHGFERLGGAAVEQFSAFEGGWDLRELRALKRAAEVA